MIRQPASVIVAGPSGSGKSELVEKLLKEKTLFDPAPKKVVYVMTAGKSDSIV